MSRGQLMTAANLCRVAGNSALPGYMDTYSHLQRCYVYFSTEMWLQTLLDIFVATFLKCSHIRVEKCIMML